MSRTVLVTGATGFLGQHVVAKLQEEGDRVFPVSRALGYDLRDRGEAYRAFLDSKPDVAVHLAARVGGIGANQENPDTFFTDNMRIGMNVVEAAASARSRLVVISTVCAYPKHCQVPFKEEDLWQGYPEETNAPYGLAKRTLIVMCSGYRAKRGLKFGYLVPCNLYGPLDNFDPSASHVIPALIRKFSEAVELGKPKVTLWGTGKATRSFLYVTDAADAIARAVDRLDYDGPVNLPGCPETAIEDVAALIASLVGYNGAIFWNPERPDGQPRRAIDGTRAKELLGWEPSTPLDLGMKRTVEWWASSRETSKPQPAEA
jgi:nucleoside-diphosphate-sugar epimerase